MGGIHENKLHGQATFPYMVYRGKLPEYIRSYPLHWHEEMELVAVMQGQGYVMVQAECYEARQGDIFVIPPQMLHGFAQQQEMEMEYYNILFRLTMLEREGEETLRPLYDPGFPVPAVLRRGTELNRLLSGHISSLIESRKQKEGLNTLMIRSHLLAILYHLLSSVDAETIQAPKIRYDSLKPVLTYLQDHYSREITVGRAAALCGYSESYFMKLFRELTGVSFVQYVKRFRLERAQALLRGGCRVTEAAEQTGFHNLSYFTRAFRSQYGQTPSQYRSAFLLTGPGNDSPPQPGLFHDAKAEIPQTE